MTHSKHNLGIKELTTSNWLEGDKVSQLWTEIDLTTGEYTQITGEKWAKSILSIQLSVKVPTDIERLFKVAQGCMCYGHFFYPLYTLGLQQLHRVHEAAATHACELRNIKKKTYNDKLTALNKINLINDEEIHKWHVSRKLRNSSSHASAQTIISPNFTVGHLAQSSQLISRLFEN